MKTTLVVMAAGLGSRFGGLKQMQPVTDDGRGILDFSVYDAAKAGFDKAVFILKENMAEDFKRLVGERISKIIPVEYVLQTTDNLPEGRTKPWGTGHAVFCCKDAVDTPFAVINADDYYGANAFTDINKHLREAKDFEFSMVAYNLANTLSKNGTVARGICSTKDGFLQDIVERTKIQDCKYLDGDEWVELPPDTKVSMNLWGLTPEIFPVLERDYREFLDTANLDKDEFFLPSVINRLVHERRATVKVLENRDKWYGITYREDLDELKAVMKKYIDEGLYSK